MTDLLPCPFCGSTNLRYEFAGSQGYIECNECGTEGPCDERAADPYCDDDAACDAWNRRAAALADEPAVPSALVDTHYEWELEDAAGEWQAGGSSNSQSDVEREGMRYLQTYAQDGPHKLIIRQHTTQTINEITNDH